MLHRELQDTTGVRYFYSYRAAQGVTISVAVRFVSSLLGIGGGIVHVPMALEATIVHIATGTLAWNLALAHGASIGVGALGGALLLVALQLAFTASG